jgi:hypothetical protein
MHAKNEKGSGWCLKKVISGGQTGVDRAALDCAIDHCVEHGGWCPRHRLAADGPIPARYQLQETDSAGYSQRTRLNVATADATLILMRGELVGGTRLTKRFADGLAKPLYMVDLQMEQEPQIAPVHRWLSDFNIQTLNVAGPSEERCPGIRDQAYGFLKKVFMGVGT